MTSTNSEQTAPLLRSSNAKLLNLVRKVHLYLGVFFAPAIIFFSVTGALQLFGLHEGHPGEAYQPPKWIAAISSIHKDQVLSRSLRPAPARDHENGPQGPRKPPDEDKHQEGTATFVLKGFFLAMSIGLIGSTLLGIYMAFRYNRSRRVLWGLLCAGAVIPAALIAAMA